MLLVTNLINMLIISVSDIKTRKIPLSMLLVLMLTALYQVMMKICNAGPSAELLRGVMAALLGALPGVALTVLSVYSDKVGRGDGLVVAIIGLCESCTFATLMMCFACILLALFSMVLMCMRKITRNTRMPYMPFLTASYAVIKLCVMGVYL